jgi:SAM-dependent methyltransferase
LSASPPDPELAAALATEHPGSALDLACGGGRHALWLASRGWRVTACDRIPVNLPGIEFHTVDLEAAPYPIAPAAWDLIVCWLYWQPELLPSIAAGVCPGGIVALAGKTDGRFATSVANYRAAFEGWIEIAAGEASGRAWFIARRPASPQN